MTELRVVLVTCESEEQGVAVARALVERRLAACVNVVPGVRSIYRWEGEVKDDREVLLVAKTTAARVAALGEAVRSLHSYSCPETIALPVTEGSARYLAWVSEEASGR